MARKSKKNITPIPTKTLEEMVQEFIDKGGEIKKYPERHATGAYRGTVIGQNKK